MRRLFALLLLACLPIAACGLPERDPSVVEFWTLQLSPTFDDYIEGLIAEFEAQNPDITIRWVDVPYDGITRKYLNAIAAGQSPDVVNLPADFIRKYAELGALAPLDTLLSPQVVDAYLPAAVDPLRMGGATYAVPWYLSTQIVIYDRERLSAAGFDAPPQTYDELLAFAHAFHERTGDYAFFTNLIVESDLIEVLEAEGVPVVNEDETRATFNTPRGREVLASWRDAFREGTMPRESIAQPRSAALRLYQSGTIALFTGGPQFLRIVEENAPSLFASTDVAPAIVGEEGSRNLAVMSLAVANQAANPQAAADWAAFVTNGPNQLAFSRIVPVFPSVTETLTDPYFTADDSTLVGRARGIAAGQLIGSRVLKPSLPNYNRLQEAFKSSLLRAFKDDRSLDDALAEAQEDWDKILEESARYQSR
jgi:putative chitobiose transport system substrate-binding protein